jgi:hypothetical protein
MIDVQPSRSRSLQQAMQDTQEESVKKRVSRQETKQIRQLDPCVVMEEESERE